MKLNQMVGMVVPVIVAGGAAVMFAVPQVRQLFTGALQSGGQAVAEAQLDEDEKEGEQLDGYIFCINNVNHRARDSMRRYADWVEDMDKGPTGEETNVYGLYKIDDSILKLCKEKLETSARLATNEQLKALAGPYTKAMEAFVPKMSEVAYYYEQGKYKDDKFAQGKKLHGPLVAEYKKFIEKAKELESAVDKVGDERSAKLLAKIEKEEGKTLAYWQRKTMIDSKAIIKMADNEKVDVAKLGKKLDELEGTIKELDKRPESEQPRLWTFFKDTPKDFLKAGRAFWRRLRDKKEFTESEIDRINTGSGQTVDGSYDQFLKAYNDMVDGSNKL